MSVSRTFRADTAPQPVSGTPENGIRIEFLIDDPELIRDLEQFEPGEPREKFAMQALKIGLLALRQARGEIDADVIRSEGKQLLSSLQSQLETHSQLVRTAVDAELKQYFDPESGRLHERLQRLLKQDGELEQVLQKHIGQQDSELVKTLSAHMGAESPLLRHLDPEDSSGLLCLLQKSVDETLAQQREKILQEFSLDHKEGALARFIRELTERQGELSGDLSQKIDQAVGEFSLDNEDSALSRLVRNVHQAQKTISAEFSFDEEQSALSKLRRILEATQQSINNQLTLDDDTSSLARLRKELTEILQQQAKSSQEFQQEVSATLQAMNARKQEAARGTQHGIEFEDSLRAYLEHQGRRGEDIITATGSTTGRIKNCKVGDFTIELGPESSAAGARIVLEAKDKRNYQLAEARAEIATARDNRDAQVGLFVFMKEQAPEQLEPVSRLGNDVYVTWDPNDPSTDLYLDVGLTLSRALCVRARAEHESHSADFQEIERAILEVEKQIAAMDDIETWVRTITNNSEKVTKKLGTMRKSLSNQCETLREKIEELKADDGES